MLAVYRHVVRVDKYIIKVNYDINIQKMLFINHWKAMEVLVRPKYYRSLR